MIHLQPVPSDRVEALWVIIEQGVRKCTSRLSNLGEDPDVIRQQLVNGYNNLVLIMDASQYKGFFTSNVIHMGKEQTFIVGLLYSILVPARLKEIVPPLKMLAASFGCTRISSFNHLTGFQRIAPELGLQPRIIEYTMEV